MNGAETYEILIEKFLYHYDPFFSLGIEKEGLSMEGVTPQPEYEDISYTTKRKADYHLRRIKFFVEELAAGRFLDPITIDNRGNTLASMRPVLLDGHHRLIASIVAGKDSISCTYGGKLSFLEEMMTGKQR